MKKLLLILISILQINSVMAQDDRFSSWVYDINQAMEDINIYTNPQDRQYLVRPALEDWLSRALGANIRKKWANTTQMSEQQRNEINKKLDGLKSAAVKKLPLHVPGSEKFAFGTDQEIQLLKDKITDLNDCVLHKIGIQDKTWIIERDGYGNIVGRRKWGYLWVNNKFSDAPFCRMVELYLYQRYEGGGSYGEAYGTFERSWWVGCPK
jgi:hypothetical protein